MIRNMKKASPKLSKTGKMPCKSWSLPAWDTCPGAKEGDGTAVEACSHCYARQGMYRFGVVKAAREHNMADWQLPDWEDAMVKAIGNDKYFRWFDSGDVYCVDLAYKIGRVILRTLGTKHWLPTRSHKDKKIKGALELIQGLPNVVVRLSSDSVQGELVATVRTKCGGSFHQNSTIVQSPEDFDKDKHGILCRAFQRAGKCGDCRACWSKKVTTVSYALHGQRIKEPELQEV